MRSSSLARSIAAKYTTCLTDADSTGPSSLTSPHQLKEPKRTARSLRVYKGWEDEPAPHASQQSKPHPGARVISAASVPSGCRSDAYFPSPLLAFLRLPTLQAVRICRKLDETLRQVYTSVVIAKFTMNDLGVEQNRSSMGVNIEKGQ